MKNGISVDSKNEKPNLSGERLYIDEDELSRYEIHLNHYPIQSYNWFMSVKATRGDVAWQKKDKIRDKLSKMNVSIKVVHGKTEWKI